MTEPQFDLVGEDDFCILSDMQRPSKAAERRQAIQEDLDDLMDLYPEYEDVLNELRF